MFCLHTTCLPGVLGDQKRVQDPLELVVSGGWPQVLCKSNNCPSLLSHLFGP